MFLFCVLFCLFVCFGLAWFVFCLCFVWLFVCFGLFCLAWFVFFLCFCFVCLFVCLFVFAKSCAGTVMTSFCYASTSTHGNLFQTNQPERESDDRAGDTETYVCFTNEKDMALQRQI